MNVLGTLHCWELYMPLENDGIIIRYRKCHDYKIEKVLRIDFETWTVETETGYYKLGEHK